MLHALAIIGVGDVNLAIARLDHRGIGILAPMANTGRFFPRFKLDCDDGFPVMTIGGNSEVQHLTARNLGFSSGVIGVRGFG